MKYSILIIQILAGILLSIGIIGLVKSFGPTKTDRYIYQCDNTYSMCVENCIPFIDSGNDVNCDVKCSSALVLCERKCHQ